MCASESIQKIAHTLAVERGPVNVRYSPKPIKRTYKSTRNTTRCVCRVFCAKLAETLGCDFFFSFLKEILLIIYFVKNKKNNLTFIMFKKFTFSNLSFLITHGNLQRLNFWYRLNLDYVLRIYYVFFFLLVFINKTRVFRFFK